jgi:tRNA(Ile)-lysidine synthase
MIREKMEISNRFERNWLSKEFPSKKNSFLVAVSGGKDSMCLLHLMLSSGFSFAIAHCNYQLRAEESDKDELLVQEWAAKHQIKFHQIKFDTLAEMEVRKMGVQETARFLRYNWFYGLCSEYGYQAICTAHHANDNAETLLINLLKGTGIAGLHGIPLINNLVIRPLLFATKNEIDNYALLQNIPYREDASNTNTKYLRNAVRHKILPVIIDIFPNAIQQISETTARIQQVELIYKNAIEDEKKALLERRGNDIYLSILKLKKRPAFETICYEIFHSFGYSSVQVPEIIKLINSESGHYIDTIQYRTIKDRKSLIITEKKSTNSDHIPIPSYPQEIFTAEGKFIFNVHKVNIDNIDNPNIALLDARLISGPILLRRRAISDYFYPLGMGMKKKKISKFLIDQKIPLHQKEKIWIVENEQRIVWVAGMRLDERFKIGPKTDKIIRIEFIPNS